MYMSYLLALFLVKESVLCVMFYEHTLLAVICVFIVCLLVILVCNPEIIASVQIGIPISLKGLQRQPLASADLCYLQC